MLMGAFSPSGIGAPVLIEDLSKLDNQSCPSVGCHLVCPSKEGSCNLPLPKLGSPDKTHDSGHNWDFACPERKHQQMKHHKNCCAKFSIHEKVRDLQGSQNLM
jgi:hypothetical protein